MLTAAVITTLVVAAPLVLLSRAWDSRVLTSSVLEAVNCDRDDSGCGS
jgi:hypothetical protein